MHSLATVGVLAAVMCLLAPSPADAALDITVQANQNLGSRQVGGGSLTASLGTVTVTSADLVGTWTATVSSTNCITGAGASFQTVPSGNLSYWSGPVTATTGTPASITPGQPTATDSVTLSSDQIAFSATAVDTVGSSVSWNPTLTMTVPSNVVAGSYTCTVTHSVA